MDDLNDRLIIEIEDDDIDTIGGWFMTRHFDAKKGDQVSEQGYDFIVRELEGHHLIYLEIIKHPELETECDSTLLTEEI